MDYFIFACKQWNNRCEYRKKLNDIIKLIDVISYICLRNRQIQHKSMLILLSLIHQWSLYVMATKDHLLALHIHTAHKRGLGSLSGKNTFWWNMGVFICREWLETYWARWKRIGKTPLVMGICYIYFLNFKGLGTNYHIWVFGTQNTKLGILRVCKYIE